MRADEIHRHLLLVHVVEEVRYPGDGGGGRSAHAQARADRLQRPCGVVVEFEIRRLGRGAVPERDVRFVPHLEVPARHLVDAVAFDQMAGKRLDQVVPHRVALRRRGAQLVEERLGGIRVAVEIRRHEAQLDIRLDAQFQQAVVDLVDVGEVVDRLALLVQREHADVLVEDAVRAHVGEAGDLPDHLHVAPVVGTQRQRRAAGAEHLLPEMREGGAFGLRVDADVQRFRRGGGGCAGGGAQQQRRQHAAGEPSGEGVAGCAGHACSSVGAVCQSESPTPA